MEPILRPDPTLYESWMLPVFIVGVLIIAYVRAVYSRRINLLLKSVIRLQILRQVMREELLFSHRASLLLFLNFSVSAGLILYALSKYFNVEPLGLEGGFRFLAYSGIVLVLYILKFLFIALLRWLFDDKGLLREYLFAVFSVMKVLGIFLLPLALILVTVNTGDVEPITLVTAALVLCFLLFRTAQGLILSFSYSVSRVYIILYLCTLEMVPFFLLMSFVKRSII